MAVGGIAPALRGGAMAVGGIAPALRGGAMAVAVAFVLCVGASTAHAHFRLLKPTAWIMEDGLGDPQKAGPCGTNASTPGTPTNAITTFKPGETITVEWAETIPHPGHFRIAVARDRSELMDPDIEFDGSCNYAPGSVGTEPPVYPVLLDNLYPRDNPGFGESFTQEVTLPDMECEKCTLQVIQWMTEHAPSCIYYHCADIAIVADDSGEPQAGAGAGGSQSQGGTGGGGAGSAGGAAGSSGSGGMTSPPMTTAGTGSAGTTGTTIGGIGAGGAASGTAGMTAAPVAGTAAPSGPASSSDSGGGCGVTSSASRPLPAGLLSLALVALVRRRRRAA
jgi:MYXO-CTERM domain-containing protein